MKEEKTRIVKNASIFTKVVEGKVFLMDIDSASLLELNEVGASIWESLSQPRRVGEVVEKITREFEVNAAQAQKDVSNFLSELKRCDLIEVEEVRTEEVL